MIILLFIFFFFALYSALTMYMVYRGCNYVVTPKREIQTALSVLKPKETFIDLGFGYGEVLDAALANDAGQVIGYELDPIRYLRGLVKFWGNPKVKLYFADIWSADLSHADVVFTFFTVRHMPKLYAKAKREMSAHTWFVSYVHEVTGVKPTKQIGQVRFFRI